MPRLCSWFVWVHMLNSNWHEARRPYQPVAKVDDSGSTKSIEFRTLDSHGDGQKTGGATGVADVGGHGGPSDE